MAEQDEFTPAETERQDYVDNEIYNLLLNLGMLEEEDLPWDMEEIGEIRDLIGEILIDKHQIITEQDFYPFRRLEPDENIILEPSKPEPKIIVTEDQIIAQMQDFLTECDADELARLAGEIFGGECYFGEDNYNFYPDKDNYFGAFGEIKPDGN